MRTQRKNWIAIFPNGREVLNLHSPRGLAEYLRRIEEMLERQGGICCLSRFCPLCPGKLLLREACFEHEEGRGASGGHRDDRIWVEGRAQNGAAHYWCNSWKGSKRLSRFPSVMRESSEASSKDV